MFFFFNNRHLNSRHVKRGEYYAPVTLMSNKTFCTAKKIFFRQNTNSQESFRVFLLLCDCMPTCHAFTSDFCRHTLRLKHALRATRAERCFGCYVMLDTYYLASTLWQGEEVLRYTFLIPNFTRIQYHAFFPLGRPNDSDTPLLLNLFLFCKRIVIHEFISMGPTIVACLSDFRWRTHIKSDRVSLVANKTWPTSHQLFMLLSVFQR